jgi:hypothetical protein
MKWMKDRDLLIAQTMAFVQSVTGKKSEPISAAMLDGTKPDVEAASAEARRVALEIVDPSYASAKDAQIASAEPRYAEIPPTPVPQAIAAVQTPRAIVQGDYRNEIQSRVANFRAHQERFNREREDYFNATFAKARALTGDHSPSTPPSRK